MTAIVHAYIHVSAGILGKLFVRTADLTSVRPSPAGLDVLARDVGKEAMRAARQLRKAAEALRADRYGGDRGV